MTRTPGDTIMDAADVDLRGLLSTFGDEGDLERFTPVEGAAVPQPFNRLLVHDQHMTVTLEDHHGGPLHLSVRDSMLHDDEYARKITLHARPDGPPVLLGIMKFNFRYCSDATREEIVGGRTPLGRILIRHDVLRHLTPGPYFAVSRGPTRLLGLEVDLPDDCHARLARINCNGGQAVKVLEIITSIRCS